MPRPHQTQQARNAHASIGSHNLSLDEFRAQIPIVDVVGRYVRLNKRGRDLWGCCPFHNEKTASFHVVPEKSYYHCFGCGEHGNAIDFIMAVERLEFRGALLRLSELTGIAAPSFGDAKPKADPTLFEVNGKAAAWFVEQLGSPEAQSARDYLERRGLDRQTQGDFGIGFAPNERDAMRRAELQGGVDDKILLEVGLIARSDRGGDLYDRFRNRIIFPIADLQGRIVGFGGRALGDDATAKYLNTAETAIFKKGQLLYGLDRAARAARQKNSIVVAEGYLDVIALMRAGIDNAVAPLGTAITEEQLGLLWRYADTPLLCLDGDAAGLRAAMRAATRALPLLAPGKSLNFCLLPEGEDPDSILHKHGKDRLVSRLEVRLPLIDLLWRHESAQFVDDTPEGRALLERRLRDLAETIADRSVRYQYQEEFRERLRRHWRERREAARRGSTGTTGASYRREYTKGAQPASSSAPPSTLALGVQDPDWRREFMLLANIVINPWLIRHIGDRMSTLELGNSTLDALRQELIEWASTSSDLDGQLLQSHLVHYGFAETLDRITELGKFTQPVAAGDAEFLASWLEAASAYEGRGRYRRGIRELEQRAAISGTLGTTAYLSDLSKSIGTGSRVVDEPASGHESGRK